jgi:phosphoglycolate phosphatase-like HAD superfamily hydrolase
VRDGARCKLEHYDLWHFFPFGSFADGIHDRDDIARAAIPTVASHLGKNVHPSRIWVIGDTPLDVQCARAIGAQAVAVATGWHSIEELTDSKADWVLADFREPSALLRAWEVE